MKATRRRILGLLLGVQLVGALVPLADARLERPREAAVHVEAPGSDACDPVHVHAHCALCQHLAQRQVPADPAVAVASAAKHGVVPSRTIAVAARPTVALERGRSPPQV